MKIQCTGSKTLELNDGSEKLGVLSYESLFSYKANVIAGKDQYEITPKGIFSTNMSVTKNGTEVAIMKMNWKGNITISFQNGREFILKATGTFLNKYVLEDQDQQKLILLDPDFNPAKLSYNYNISSDSSPAAINLTISSSRRVYSFAFVCSLTWAFKSYLKKKSLSLALERVIT